MILVNGYETGFVFCRWHYECWDVFTAIEDIFETAGIAFIVKEIEVEPNTQYSNTDYYVDMLSVRRHLPENYDGNLDLISRNLLWTNLPNRISFGTKQSHMKWYSYMVNIFTTKK